MPAKIVEFELTEPLPPLTTEALRGYAYLLGMVRYNTVPLGYVWWEIDGLDWAESTLRQKIEQEPHIAEALHKLTLRENAGNKSENQPDEKLPLVTVVVCTRDRPEPLVRCLESLLRLDYPNLDILIVDNAPSNEKTKELVQSLESSVLRYVVEPRPGLDWARNRGIVEARGEIIAYTDDDVRVDPLWVRRLVAAFADPGVMAVTGLVAPAERETEAQDTFEHYGGFGRGFERKEYSLTRQRYRHFPLNASIFGTGCNMAYRRRFFEQHGLFDESLDVGTLTHGGGDLDMFYRVVRAGYTLVYEPEALVWHYHRRDFARLKRQLYDNGRGYYGFLTKCFLNDKPMRYEIGRWGIIWYKRWFIDRLRHCPRIGRKLVLREAWGAVQGPYYYFQARRQSAKIARAYGKINISQILSNPDKLL